MHLKCKAFSVYAAISRKYFKGTLYSYVLWFLESRTSYKWHEPFIPLDSSGYWRNLSLVLLNVFNIFKSQSRPRTSLSAIRYDFANPMISIQLQSIYRCRRHGTNLYLFLIYVFAPLLNVQLQDVIHISVPFLTDPPRGLFCFSCPRGELSGNARIQQKNDMRNNTATQCRRLKQGGSIKE